MTFTAAVLVVVAGVDGEVALVMVKASLKAV